MSKINGKVLVLDADQSVLFTAKMVLNPVFDKVVTETDPKKLDIHLSQENFDVIVLDMNFSFGLTGGKEGLNLLRKVLKIDPEAHILMNTTYGDIEIAVEALNDGAIDFLVKPFSKEKLLASVKTVFKLSQTTKIVNDLKAGQKILLSDRYLEFDEIIAKAPSMKPVLKQIERAAASNENVLIRGEQGTGKELIAHHIHNRSEKAKENFISTGTRSSFNSLSEQDLFGFNKGHSSDFEDGMPGRIELAKEGTLFIDEVTDLSSPLQAKLLTTLQFMQLNRMGSNKNIHLNTRLISASSRPLEELVEKNEFRQELYDNLKTVVINIPPLRDRKEDIEPLTRHFLKIYEQKFNKGKMRLNETTLSKLKDYDWPGNVRELQQAVARAVIAASSHLLAPKDFLFEAAPV